MIILITGAAARAEIATADALTLSITEDRKVKLSEIRWEVESIWDKQFRKI